MKYVNTVLLLILVTTVGINFYYDTQQKKQTEELAKAVQALEEELSPFSKTPDTYFEAPKEVSGPITSITTDRRVHNFGNIKSGEVYHTEFTITNTGNENLIISKATGSCGCTVAEWDEKPIKPKDKTTLKVSFDTNGKSGDQVKTITVITNTEPNTTVFTIKAIVER